MRSGCPNGASPTQQMLLQPKKEQRQNGLGEGIPQFINTMEAEQFKSKRAKLVINDEYLHVVSLKSLLQSGEYETETREWSKLPEDEQTWA